MKKKNGAGKQPMPQEKKGPGRPKVQLDEKLIEELGKIDATVEEVAAICGCHIDTIYARPEYSEALKRGRQNGQASVKRKIFEEAMNGNTSLLIWLSKQPRFGFYEYKPQEQLQAQAPVFNITISEGGA